MSSVAVKFAVVALWRAALMAPITILSLAIVVVPGAAGAAGTFAWWLCADFTR